MDSDTRGTSRPGSQPEATPDAGAQSAAAGLGDPIEVESDVGGGPLLRAALPSAPIAGAGAADSVASVPAVSGAPRGRILVIDDEPSIGMSIRRLLAAEHDVTVLASAREAARRVEAGERFDVILCDLMMPDMTGMDLHAELTEKVPGQADRMVMITGGAFTAKAHQFLERITNPRVEKPFAPSTLRGLIRRLVAESGRSAPLD